MNRHKFRTNFEQKNNIFIKNFIDYCEHYFHFFYKYFNCFAQLHTLRLRFENYFDVIIIILTLTCTSKFAI